MATFREWAKRGPAQDVLGVVEADQVGEVCVTAGELPDLERSVGSGQVFAQERLEPARFNLFAGPDVDRIVHTGRFDGSSGKFLRAQSRVRSRLTTGQARVVSKVCEMDTLGKALWQGVINGAGARDRTITPRPESLGFTGAIAQGLYNFGFVVANAVVYGARK